jgi:hypothetical protein
MVGGGGCNITNPPGRTGTPSPCTANGGSYGVMNNMLLDTSTGMLYAMSGNDGNSTASAVVVQMPEDLSSQVRVPVGLGSVGNTSKNVDLHRAQFDNKYWGSTPSGGHLILCGTGAIDTTPWQYWVGFSAYPTMDSWATQGTLQDATEGIPCSDSTEFYNPSIDLLGISTDHDLLMWGLIGSGLNGNFITADISWADLSIVYPAGETFINYTGGVSDSIVDNDGNAPGESSFYFSTLEKLTIPQGTCAVGEECAVRISQNSLN